MKPLIMIALLASTVVAKENIKALQFAGVEISHKDKKLLVERVQKPACLELGITPDTIFGGVLADEKVPAECKKSFVSTVGVIQPMRFDDEIETVAELEVLHLIKKMQVNPEKYLLVDARKSSWFEELTLPSAVNIPYTEIAYDKEFPEDFSRNLQLLNITKNSKGELDFSEAKEAILFCNGAWCVQSEKAIKELVKLGYPKKKLFWYRGGLQDWAGLGFTTVKP